MIHRTNSCEEMEDFLNLHGISRSDVDPKETVKRDNLDGSHKNVTKRNSKKFVRSDALSPNSANKFLIESELEKISRRNLMKTPGGQGAQEIRNNNNINNNLETKMDLGSQSK